MFRIATHAFVIQAASVVALAAPARASVLAGAGLLDQEQVADFGGNNRYSYGVSSDFRVAQTFTVGRSGVLDRLELQVWRDPAPTLPTQPLLAQIRRTLPDGAPDTSLDGLLTTVSFPASEITTATYTDAFSGRDLGAQSVLVVAGQRLVIVLAAASAADHWYHWGTSNTSGQGPEVDYPGGSNYTRLLDDVTYTAYPEIDHGFRTFVIVPEPATLAHAVAAMLCLSRRARPRRR